MRESESVHDRFKITIIVWGFSIHAKRRIEVFSEDSLFDVSVISNYPYTIQDVNVFLLPSGKREIEKKTRDEKKPKDEKKLNDIAVAPFIKRDIICIKKIKQGLEKFLEL